ncbi:uncharacterized protein LOC123308546 [Coccinella septempunctata]|uniref:uncharacterized protein LOC123308546 n=1 Tax=Coccinella septempunctata TaxID=41139 RepID=UPI001D064EBB|nr:uncharacterized protein LOC123308546 [Coccinella septempunctata]
MRSDKGNSTVVMLKSEYREYMYNLLADILVYKKLKTDPTLRLERRANQLINELKIALIVDEITAQHMKQHNSVPPKLYGLRKTHKQELCIRPIVSCLGAPSYHISQFVHNILSMVNSTSPYTIKNSYEFVSFSETIVLPKGFMLYSLDVVSLFTNIPRDLVLSLIKEKWLFISAYTDMPKNLFIDIIAYIYDSSYFQFEGEFYQQIDGSAMGNPASPSLANFIMTYLIEKVLQKLKFIVVFIKLYVDDTITAIPSDKADELLSEFNSYHPRIKFTIEKEKDGELPFLDIKVVRGEDGSLLTKWYVKPTNSGRLVNFHSETSRSYKVGSIKNLIYRSTHLQQHS